MITESDLVIRVSIKKYYCLTVHTLCRASTSEGTAGAAVAAVEECSAQAKKQRRIGATAEAPYQQQVVEAYRQLKARRKAEKEREEQQQQHYKHQQQSRKNGQKGETGADVQSSSKPWSYDKSLLYRSDWIFKRKANDGA